MGSEFWFKEFCCFFARLRIIVVTNLFTGLYAETNVVPFRTDIHPLNISTLMKYQLCHCRGIVYIYVCFCFF